jgi:ABC-type multidrug transport system permease subunit
MYTTDVIWWGYTIFVAMLALFMLYFASKVRQKGD